MNLLDHLLVNRRRAGTVGLDIGRRAIKAVRRERGRVVAHALEPWQPPAMFGTGDSVGVLADAVRRAVVPFGLRRRQAATCVLSMSFGSLRGFELPTSSDEELAEMVRQEFAADPEFEPLRSEVACWRAPSADALQSVCGWALPHAVSRYVAGELGRAGLSCAAIDAIPFTVARAVGGLEEGFADAPAAVVDWGAHSPSLTIVQRGRPVFTRALRDCGHARVVARLEEGLGLAPAEAWTFLDNFAARTDAAPEVRQLLEEYAREAAERLVAEVERTVDFLGERIPGLAPRVILLTGGGAELVLEPLRAAFGARVVTWSEASSRGTIRSHGMNGGAPALPSVFGIAASLSAREIAS